MPSWELRFWEKKLAKEPAPVERLEWALANLCAITVNVNRGKRGRVRKTEDFMLFRKAFKAPYSEDPDVDSDIGAIIGVFGTGNVVEKKPGVPVG